MRPEPGNPQSGVDDLLMLNNKCLESAIDNIYPPELQLKKKTDCPTKLS